MSGRAGPVHIRNRFLVKNDEFLYFQKFTKMANVMLRSHPVELCLITTQSLLVVQLLVLDNTLNHDT